MIEKNSALLSNTKKDSNRKAQARYRTSPKGRAKIKAYEQTPARRYRAWYREFLRRLHIKKQRVALLEEELLQHDKKITNRTRAG